MSLKLVRWEGFELGEESFGALPNLQHYCYFEYLRVDSTYSFFVPGGLNQLDLMFDIEFNYQQHMYVPT